MKALSSTGGRPACLTPPRLQVLSTSITGLNSCVCLTVFGTQVCGIRVHLALTNLLKTPPVGTKPTPDGARQIGSRCGPAKPRPRFQVQRPSRLTHREVGPPMQPHKENMLTPTPHRTVSLRREPYRTVRKKQQHRTMLLLQRNHPLFTLPHGKGFEVWRPRSRT